jgi:hypothetical protein
MKSRCSSECLSGCASTGFGFRCSPPVLGVARWTPGCSHGRLVDRAREQDRPSSLELTPSFRVRRSPSGPCPYSRPKSLAKTRAPPVRFGPLQRLPARGSGTKKVTGLPTPDRPPPSGFLDLLAFEPPRTCWPCFMPHPLLGLCPPELSSSRAAVRRLRRRSPLVVRANPPTAPPAPNHSRRSDRRQNEHMERPRERPRLQGFAPHENPPPDTGG